MAKARKVKTRVPSVKSRAARRASSPSINIDKSIKDIKPPIKTEITPAILAARNDAGISKRKKQKPISRQKRLRQEKGIERADIVLDKLENKVSKSKNKAKIIKQRASDWEDLNTTGEKRKFAKRSSLSTPGTVDAMEDVVDNPNTNDRRSLTTNNTGVFDGLEEIT